MKCTLTVFLLYSLVTGSVFGQGTFRGKIADNNGEELIGAAVYVKNNNSVATITDFQGNFSLKVPSDAAQVIQLSYVGQQTIEDTIYVESGKVLVRNYMMQTDAEELEEVIVYGRANKAQDSYMRAVKLKSATNIDYISKETIRKTGDSNVDDAIKRVTGVSTVQGFITVRGLADRYVKTTFNGARIPTLDPYTNNIKLDMFPTSLVDNIIVTKTQSPDLPGDWTGAFLSIETMDYPEKLSVYVKTSVGYNSQTTFKQIVSNPKSPTDWMGFDDGFRDIDQTRFSTYSPNLTAYQVFQGLGQEAYLQSLGITDHLNTEIRLIDPDDVYLKMNLVNLGVLAPAHFYDQTFIEQGLGLVTNSTGPMYQEAFRSINTAASDFGKYLPNNWVTTTGTAPLNFSQDFSIGNQVDLFDRPLGWLFGARYVKDTRSDPEGRQLSYTYYPGDDLFVSLSDFKRNSSVQTNEWSILTGLSYRFTPYHSISLLFMPNISGENKARIDSGYSKGDSDEHGFDYVVKHDQLYEERQQIIYQAQTSHFFPEAGLKLDLNASYTDGKSSVPDYKTYKYGTAYTSVDSSGNQIYSYSNSNPTRSYRYLDEDILDARIVAEQPIFKKSGLVRRIRLGGSYLSNIRETGQYKYFVPVVGGPSLSILDPSTFLNQSKFELNQHRLGYLYMNSYYVSLTNDILFNLGHSNISSAFLMLDYEFFKRLRFSGGLRAEYTDLFNDVKRYHELGYPKDDPRRVFPSLDGGAPPGTKGNLANPTQIYSLDYIPSANLVLKLVEQERSNFILRLNYSRSLARPSIREVSPFWFLDYELNAYILGNPDLRMSYINNYDLRLESYFQSGEFVSVSLFHKQFTDHIEIVFINQYTWENARSGIASGIEFEARKRIIKNLHLSTNLTMVQSNTQGELYDETNTMVGYFDRPMYGQAPYVINALLDYSSDKLGLSFAISYNVQGPKIALASRSVGVPDIYELPIHRLDFKISQRFAKRFAVEFRMRNILNEAITRSYYYNGSYDDYIYDSYSFGTDYILSLSYSL